MDLENYYKERLQEAQRNCQRIKSNILHISLIRVILFLCGFIFLCMAYDKGGWVIGGILLGTCIPFIILVKRHNHLFHLKEWHETAGNYYQNELASLKNDHSAFDGGMEWIDGSHPYTFDLDVFGNRSLFQLVNRTCTSIGKETLSRWFRNHLTDKKEIEQRQQAINELSSYTTFREHFLIAGHMSKAHQSDLDSLKSWVDSPTSFLQKKRNRWLCRAVPLINAIMFLLAMAGILSFNWFSFTFGCFLVASLGLVKRITHIQEGYNKTLKTLSTYAQLISMAEQQEMQSAMLKEVKAEFSSNGKSAINILNILSKELDRLDLRNNQILYVLLEGSLFWQMRQMLQIEQWKQDYGNDLLKWLDSLGKLDALCALGTFAYNHPEYSYPIIAEKPFILQGEDIGHPLMPRKQCITNNAEIPSRPYFLIITGANMAGKSTYLRTIGTNYLLACIGAPVCCSQFEIYPAQLMTSLRTTDSLVENESYFFAELKRLKQIIERLNNGEEMFIILDEILKGTNSIDKQKGSLALVQQLIQLRANGIIATHDLMLGDLVHHFPQEIKNYCFEADIFNNELIFSYKLRKGIAQNMNACFLMKKMGIIIND